MPPLAYFTWVWYKGSLSLVDAGVLIAMYFAYLAVLWRLPPEREEGLADAPRVSRWAYTRPGIWRGVAIAGLFIGGGALIYLTAHPFLESMLALAATLGVSQFVFVQWVAPFISEFPEKVSAFHWASRVKTAPMAMMNMMSSNINQWTVLAAMIPIAFSLARGEPGGAPLRRPAARRDPAHAAAERRRGAAPAQHEVRVVERGGALRALAGAVPGAALAARDRVGLRGSGRWDWWCRWIWYRPTAPRVLWKLLGSGQRLRSSDDDARLARSASR